MASTLEVVGDGFDMDDDTTFLFTSESVGEGHPGAGVNVVCNKTNTGSPKSLSGIHRRGLES